MDKHFIKRLHTLNRRDELRSRILIEGVKLTLKQKKEMGVVGRFFNNIKRRLSTKEGTELFNHYSKTL